MESESQWAEILGSPLHLAVMSRQPGIAESLLSTAADVGLLEEVLAAKTGMQFNRHFKDSLNLHLNHRFVQCLPKSVLNLCLNLRPNSSLKF